MEHDSGAGTRRAGGGPSLAEQKSRDPHCCESLPDLIGFLKRDSPHLFRNFFLV